MRQLTVVYSINKQLFIPLKREGRHVPERPVTSGWAVQQVRWVISCQTVCICCKVNAMNQISVCNYITCARMWYLFQGFQDQWAEDWSDQQTGHAGEESGTWVMLWGQMHVRNDTWCELTVFVLLQWRDWKWWKLRSVRTIWRN